MAQIGDIGIDLGTSNVLIYMKGRGIVLREPAVVAVERDTRKSIAVGKEALRMVGRTPASMQVIRPLRNGTVADFELARVMLQQFILQAVGRRFFSRPRAVISVPSGVTDTEKRSIISALLDAGMRRTQILDRPVAAALGIGLPFEDPYGTMIVDMGAGLTDIAILSSGKTNLLHSVPMGGDAFDDAIIRYLRRKHNLLIGERTAEELKVNIGCAVPRQDEISMDVTGRNLISGLPKTLTVTSSEVYEAIRECVTGLTDAIHAVLENASPQLASDIFEDGIIFTGGASALVGLTEAVGKLLNVPCGVAEDPQTSVVMGCGRVVDDLSGMKHLLGSNRQLGR